MSPRASAARAAAALLCLAASPALAAPAAAAPERVAGAAAVLTSTAGDQARFLAGLPVAVGSPLHALTTTREWIDHQQAMDKAWPRLAGRLAKAAAFEASTLAPLIQRSRNVIYFFGGPDAAHAVTLFPDASAYLLAGLEPVGSVQPPETLKPAEVHKAIDGLSVALKTIIEKSFFRTSDMGRDLQGRGIRGVEPVLFIFLARTGAEVLGASYFEVNAAGVAADKAPGERFGAGVPGVRIRFQFPGKPVQEMSYVRVDLSDGALAREPGFLLWARSFGPANGFLKAASFILHDGSFSRPRAFLLENCAAILQDDSGVPYRIYKKAGWDLTCLGKYHRPRDPFEDHEQKDLAEACAAQSGPIDFIIGYRRSTDSALQLYVKRPGAVTPEITAAPAPRGRTAPRALRTPAAPAPAPAVSAAPAAPAAAAAPAPLAAPAASAADAAPAAPAAEAAPAAVAAPPAPPAVAPDAPASPAAPPPAPVQ